ncbi:MAG: Coenzyme F420 hydrogenase/dehydrogenase, beta subunit C-terminal domain [Candidatus Bathyarchaeia archaeon]
MTLSTEAKTIKVFSQLAREVVKQEKCTFCGACISVCPVKAISVKDGWPTLTGRCVLCQLCYYQCPKTEPTLEELERGFFKNEEDIGNPLGFHKAIYTAESTDEKIKSKAANGGVATTLLKIALEEGWVDCATVAVADRLKGWMPEAKVAFTFQEVLEAAGSKYTYCPMVTALASAFYEYMRNSVAFVGTPCQVLSVRKMQLTSMGHRKLGEVAKIIVGLFCMENFDYNLISEFLPSRGIKPEAVFKFDISGGKFNAYGEDGENLISVGVKELEKYSRKGCMACSDLTARWADVSVGSIGSKPGFSTVIIRTDIGEEIFKRALELKAIRAEEISEQGLKSLIRVAKVKLDKAEKTREKA